MSLSMSRRGVLMTGAAAGLLTASGSKLKAEPKKGGKLIVGKGHGSTSDSLDPGSWENGFTIALAFGMHNYVTEVAPDGSLVGQIAETWEGTNGGKTWTFMLRKGVTFHNGADVTANDVIASINHHRGEESQSAAKVIVEPIESMRADGDHTVVFELNAGNADFPFILSDYHLPIMQADGEKVSNFENGCGAYKLQGFEPGVRASFLKNENYWRDDRGHFDEIEMLAIVDGTARTNALLSGQVHAIDKVDSKTTALFKRAPGVNLEAISGTQHYTFPMNSTASPYDDNNVRQAIKYGVNRQELVDKVLGGYGSVGNDHPIGSGQRYFNKDLAQKEYDADKAKWYLKQSDLTSVDIEVSVADAAFDGAVDAGQLMSASAAAAGINMSVKREPNDGYWSNVWMKKPFCACYWGGRPVEDQMFSTAYAKGVSWNDTYWDNERFNKLLVEARAELNEDKRREMYYEMQDIVANQGSTLIPMFASYIFAISDKVGYGDMASNWDMDGERWMERWWMA